MLATKQPIPRDCLEAEQLVLSTMPDAGELEQRTEFQPRPARTPNLGMHVHMSRSYPGGSIWAPGE